MEDLNPSIQTDDQLGAGPSAEAMLANPVPKSPGARQPMKESTAAADELGGGERLASMVDEPATVPRATAGAAGSSEADAGVADAAPELGAEEPVEPKEQAALSEMSEGVVGRAVQPPSP